MENKEYIKKLKKGNFFFDSSEIMLACELICATRKFWGISKQFRFLSELIGESKELQLKIILSFEN
jgi:hypothetical protein